MIEGWSRSIRLRGAVRYFDLDYLHAVHGATPSVRSSPRARFNAERRYALGCSPAERGAFGPTLTMWDQLKSQNLIRKSPANGGAFSN